jgi:phage shock protein PspC (stress-responsive transcriptional regulator)
MSTTILSPVRVRTSPNAYACLNRTGAERDLLLMWLATLEASRLIATFMPCESITDTGVMFTVIVGGASLTARVLLDVAFSAPRLAFVLGRLWGMPGCCAGLAQDFGWPVVDVREALDTLAGAGLVYEYKGTWRAYPLTTRGGAA